MGSTTFSKEFQKSSDHMNHTFERDSFNKLNKISQIRLLRHVYKQLSSVCLLVFGEILDFFILYLLIFFLFKVLLKLTNLL